MSTINPNNSIQTFINGFGGGLRPNRFKVEGTIPTATQSISVSEKLTFLVRATTLPSSDLSLISVPYRGRDFKIPGNRTYLPWQMVVLDDKGGQQSSDLSLWKRFHIWSNVINSHKGNLTSNTGNDSKNFKNYFKNFTVTQLDINGNCEKQIELVDCWPSEVGPISLEMGDNENYSTFIVTLEYQYFNRIENIRNCTGS